MLGCRGGFGAQEGSSCRSRELLECFHGFANTVQYGTYTREEVWTRLVVVMVRSSDGTSYIECFAFLWHNLQPAPRPCTAAC
jgi:hypothetical protein